MPDEPDYESFAVEEPPMPALPHAFPALSAVVDAVGRDAAANPTAETPWLGIIDRLVTALEALTAPSTEGPVSLAGVAGHHLQKVTEHANGNDHASAAGYVAKLDHLAALGRRIAALPR